MIITADAQGGMLDIHDRRPVVLPADLAREWIDPNTTSQRAEQIVQELGLQSEAFEWYQVSKAVGNVKNTGAALIGPLIPRNHPTGSDRPEARCASQLRPAGSGQKRSFSACTVRSDSMHPSARSLL